MQTRTFLSSVLSAEGYYCVVGLKPDSDKKIQKFFPSIEAVLEVAENLKNEGYNAYFALSTFENGASRKGSNAKYLKSFFLDIDCGAGKEYINQAAGVTALRLFCKATQLPRPTVVNSGRGLHVYWTLDEQIAAAEWAPLAEKLKILCKNNNLHADPSVTSDVARILRVPGTMNFKSDPPSGVQLLGEIAAAIPLSVMQRVTFSIGDVPAGLFTGAPATGPSDETTDTLAGNYRNVFKTIMVKTIAGKGCAQIKKVVEEQATITEPMWRAGLSIAKFCVDGDKAIHKISAQHPGYSPDDTATKAALIRGPYTCDKFEEYSPGICGDCKHKGKFKSPIVLGREIQEATEEDNVVLDIPEVSATVPQQPYVIPSYPAPYFRGKAGGIYKRGKDKEGDPIETLVYHNDFYITRRLSDKDVGDAMVMRLHLPKDGVREFTISLKSILAKDSFRDHMAMHGVAVLNMGELMSYATAWVNKIQAQTTAEQAHRQFGWTDDSLTSFIVGDKDIRKDRVDHNPPASSTVKLFPAFQSKGTMEGWREIMEFYNRPGMEMHQYVIGMSFGSPLMAFSPICASLFHMYSKDSGLGKTTAMLAGASIWGNPELLMLKEVDTVASKMARAEAYKNIFLPLDEMTNIAPKEASDAVYQLTGGMQRNRMSGSSNDERTRGEAWHLMVCSTGNTSLIERIGLYKSLPKAEAARILEYRAEKFHFDTKSETDVLSTNLLKHYGHACIPYIQYCITHMDEVKELYASTQTRIDAAAGLSQPHRFWSAQAANAIVGLLIAKRVGLINFSVADVVKWLVEVLKTAKGSIDTMDAGIEDTLSNYLADNYTNILRIRSTDDSRVPSGELTDNLMVPDASPRAMLVARYEYDVRKLYLIQKPLRDWCGKQQINYAAFVDGLRKGRTKAVNKKQRMGKGTRMNLPPSDVLVLDCSEFMLDEAVSET